MRSVLFAAFISLFGAGAHAVSTPDELNPLDPNIHSGQLFTVRLQPRDKSIDVFVVGNNVAKLAYSDLHLFASVKVGNKTWKLAPGKKEAHFTLQTPEDLPLSSQPELNLKIDYQDKHEDFNIKMTPR